MFDSQTISSVLLKYWQLWLLLLIVVIVMVLIEIYLPKKPRVFGYQYRRKTSVMTQTEQKLFLILIEMAADKYHVFPQVHLDAILDYKIAGQNWFGAFRHINEKSVDFVICDKVQETPLLAIELDDRSHEREDRIRRDIVVCEIFRNSSLPLVRIPVCESSDRETIKRQVFDVLNPAVEKPVAQDH